MNKIQEIDAYLDRLFAHIGVNKKRELGRLLYEIGKREGVPLPEVLSPEKNLTFESAKTKLLQRRYPRSFATTPRSAFYLPKLELDDALRADLSERPFYPKDIFIQKSVAHTPLAERAKRLFANAKLTVLEDKRLVGSPHYSKRADTLFIHEEKYDFVKPCPCSAGAAGCGYNLINLGFGCKFECEYCFLQQYQNLHAVLLPANVTDFLAKIDDAKWNKGPFERPRIGSGEFTDSLVFDDITEYSKTIVPFFRQRPYLMFEFKTKSVNIQNLLEAGGAENIVAAWSVNAPEFIAKAEHLTPSLPQRLAAAREAVKAGYKTAFHFDPVVLFDGWKKGYAEAVEQIAEAVRPESVAWISVGTLRFSRELKKIVENRFPDNTILNGEFLLDFDGKMRYPQEFRRQAYQFLVPLIEQKLPGVSVYVCMESAQLLKEV